MLIIHLTMNLQLQSLGSATYCIYWWWNDRWSQWRIFRNTYTRGESVAQSNCELISIIVYRPFPMFCNGTEDNNYFHVRGILAPTLEIVDRINKYMSDLNDCEGWTYLSSDTTCKSDSNIDQYALLHSHPWIFKWLMMFWFTESFFDLKGWSTSDTIQKYWSLTWFAQW